MSCSDYASPHVNLHGLARADAAACIPTDTAAVTRRASHPSRICEVCGREMTWRKAWERSFDEVRYCSKSCRRTRLSAGDVALERDVLAALDDCARGVVLDPEKAILGERESVRRAVRRLAARGEVEVVQAGRVVDPSRARGPLGVRLPV